MANNCMYDMHVRGSREALEEFLHVMTDYRFHRHFYRVFSAEVYDTWQNGDGTMTYCIAGDCAWSVASCMCMDDTVGTYATGTKQNDTSLQMESERLRLEIEVFSSETGFCFQEHMLYKYGETILDKCVDFNEEWFNPEDYEGTEEEKFAQFLKEIGHEGEYRIEDLDEGGYLTFGGFSDFLDFTVN